MTTAGLATDVTMLWGAGTLLYSLSPQMRRWDMEALHLGSVVTASRAAVLLRIEKAAKSTATVTSVTAAVGIPTLASQAGFDPGL